MTSHIPDNDQVTVLYYNLYANAHRRKVKKASLETFSFRMVEEELRFLGVPRKMAFGRRTG